MNKQTVFFIVLASTCSALNGMETAKAEGQKSQQQLTPVAVAAKRSSNHTPTYELPVDEDLRDQLRALRTSKNNFASLNRLSKILKQLQPTNNIAK